MLEVFEKVKVWKVVLKGRENVVEEWVRVVIWREDEVL